MNDAANHRLDPPEPVSPACALTERAPTSQRSSSEEWRPTSTLNRSLGDCVPGASITVPSVYSKPSQTAAFPLARSDSETSSKRRRRSCHLTLERRRSGWNRSQDHSGAGQGTSPSETHGAGQLRHRCQDQNVRTMSTNNPCERSLRGTPHIPDHHPHEAPPHSTTARPSCEPSTRRATSAILCWFIRRRSPDLGLLASRFAIRPSPNAATTSGNPPSLPAFSALRAANNSLTEPDRVGKQGRHRR